MDREPHEETLRGGRSEPEEFPSPIKLTRKSVFLVILILLGIYWVLPPVYRLLDDAFGPAGRVADDKAYWEVVGASSRIARYLNVFDFRAALIASVLLYYPFMRTTHRRERRVRRGEIFTGIVNLHILVVAIVSVFVPMAAENISAVMISRRLLTALLMTATWCLIGFHLCEGRLFTPLVGLCIGTVAFYASHFAGGEEWRWFRIVASAGGQLLNFGWQLWWLIRRGSGFDLFPTGLWPAFKRCAKAFLSIAFCFWFLRGEAYTPFAGNTGDLLETVGLFLYSIGQGIMTVVAYLVPLAFLSWPEEDFSQRSRRMTVILYGVFVVLGLVRYPFFAAELINNTHHVLSQSSGQLAGVSKPLLVILGVFFAPIWELFVFLVLLRWWVRERYLVPLLVPAAGYATFLAVVAVSSLLPGLPASAPAIFKDQFVYSGIASQTVTVILAGVLLFCRLPPVKKRGIEP